MSDRTSRELLLRGPPDGSTASRPDRNSRPPAGSGIRTGDPRARQFGVIWGRLAPPDARSDQFVVWVKNGYWQNLVILQKAEPPGFRGVQGCSPNGIRTRATALRAPNSIAISECIGPLGQVASRRDALSHCSDAGHSVVAADVVSSRVV